MAIGRNNIFHFLFGLLVNFGELSFCIVYMHPWEQLSGTRGAVISYKSTSSEISRAALLPAENEMRGRRVGKGERTYNDTQ